MSENAKIINLDLPAERELTAFRRKLRPELIVVDDLRVDNWAVPTETLPAFYQEIKEKNHV